MVLGRLGSAGYLVYSDGLAGGREAIRNGPITEREVIFVSAEDARNFACNLVTVNDVVVTGPISAQLRRQLTRLGFWVECLPLTEFYKAGGGAKCLTLPIESSIPTRKKENLP
jgi:N-dimethylarginine dimethylaminohydrolase